MAKNYAIAPNISSKLERLIDEYEQFMLALIARKKIDLNEPLSGLVSGIRRLSKKYADFLFCTILMNDELSYRIRHPLMSAVVCHMMASRFDLDRQTSASLLASALTANAGMFSVMNELAEQSEGLSKSQSQIVKDHPRLSVELLEGAAIRDPVMLDTVLKHHEVLDGSGYPDGLSGEEITLLSSVLSLTDMFCAMLLPRRYRVGIYDKKAIQQVFQQRAEKISPGIVDRFVKEIGIYPPGVFVELKNTESAIVAARNPENASSPLVVSFASKTSGALAEPFVRDTEDEEYGIKKSLPPGSPAFSISEIYDVLSRYEGEAAAQAG